MVEAIKQSSITTSGNMLSGCVLSLWIHWLWEYMSACRLFLKQVCFQCHMCTCGVINKISHIGTMTRYNMHCCMAMFYNNCYGRLVVLAELEMLFYLLTIDTYTIGSGHIIT